MLRRAALRTWLGRIGYNHFPKDSHMTIPKDHEFSRRLLEHHIGHARASEARRRERRRRPPRRSASPTCRRRQRAALDRRRPSASTARSRWCGPALTLGWIVMSFGLLLVPIVGGIAVNVLQPVFFASFAIAARKQIAGRRVEMGDLFLGFRTNVRALVKWAWWSSASPS
jgi:hypothetical protein